MTVRRRKPAQDRKAEIVDIALGLAFEVGPDLVTTGMIAERMKLTQPAIYKHFPSKDDVWSAVADKLAGLIEDNIQRAEDARTSPTQHLHLLVMGHLQLVQSFPALPDIMVARDANGSLRAGRVKVRAAMADFGKALVADVQAAVDQATFRTDLSADDAAALVFGVIQSLVLQMLVNRNPSSLLDDGERLFTLLLAGFTKTGESQ